MTIIKIKLPEEGELDVILSVDSSGTDDDSRMDMLILRLERALGKHLHACLKEMGLKKMELLQD